MISTVARFLHRKINNLAEEDIPTTSAFDKNKLLLYVAGIPLLLSALAFLLLLFVESMYTTTWVVAFIVLLTLALLPALMVEMDHLASADRESSLKHELRLSRYALEKTEKALQNETIRDQRSGCFNEAYFRREVDHQIWLATNHHYQFCIGLVRIDQFGEVLEQNGAESADELLRVVGRIATRALREVDLVAYVEPEMFGLVLCGGQPEEIKTVFDRLTGYVSQVHLAGDTVDITISAGFSYFHPGMSLENLMADALDHLEKAAARPGNYVAFRPGNQGAWPRGHDG